MPCFLLGQRIRVSAVSVGNDEVWINICRAGKTCSWLTPTRLPHGAGVGVVGACVGKAGNENVKSTYDAKVAWPMQDGSLNCGFATVPDFTGEIICDC